MFTVLAVGQPQGRFARLGNRVPLLPARLWGESRRVLGVEVRYLWVGRPDRLPWRKIARLSGRRPLLLSRQLEGPPPGWPGRLFGTGELPLCLAANSAVALLEQSGIPFSCLSLGIVDRRGEYPRLWEHGVRHIPQVRIFTQRPQRLSDFCQAMLERYGAPVVACSSLSGLAGCQLVLALSPLEETQLGTNPPFVLYPDRDGRTQLRGIHLGSPCLPEQLRRHCPQGVDPVQFLSALHQLGRCAGLERVEMETLLWGGRERTLPEHARALAAAIF